MADIMPPAAPSAQPPTPYYSDESVTLYHGDSAEILPTIAPESVDVLLTDPPYFQVKDDEWDRQWKKSDEFLTWLGGIMDATIPALVPSASVWVFTSASLASRVELEVIGPRLRLLNSIRWVKKDSTHNRAEIASLRRYQTPWEGIMLAERADDVYGSASDALRRQVFAPVGAYIREERERAGLSRRDVAARLAGYKNEDSANANIFNWELGKNLISERDYESMRAALNGPYLARPYPHLRRDYEDLRRDYEDLRRDYEDLRRPFAIARASGPVTDLWDFASVEAYPGKHSCEKPLAMLDHMIGVSSKPGAVILDPFAGSGSTLRAAKDAGRQAIGIEKDEKWCEVIANRLCQDVLDFGGAA